MGGQVFVANCRLLFEIVICGSAIAALVAVSLSVAVEFHRNKARPQSVRGTTTLATVLPALTQTAEYEAAFISEDLLSTRLTDTGFYSLASYWDSVKEEIFGPRSALAVRLSERNIVDREHPVGGTLRAEPSVIIRINKFGRTRTVPTGETPTT